MAAGTASFDHDVFLTIFRNGGDTGSRFVVPGTGAPNPVGFWLPLSGPTPVVNYVAGDLLAIRLVEGVPVTSGSLIPPPISLAMEDVP